MSSLNDYLAKHYGSSSSKKKRKSKKDRESQPAESTYGVNLVIADDDDSVIANKPSPPKEKPKLVAIKPRFRDTASSWQTIQQPKALDELAMDQEEQPVIAEGAELLEEFQAEQRQKEEERRRRKEERREKAAKPKEAKQSADYQPPANKSPEPAMRYGLQTAQAVKEDTERERASYLRKLQESSDEVSGRGAQTVYRDPKTGKIIDAQQMLKDEEDKKRRREQLKEKQKEWNQGLVQQRERAEELRKLEQVRQAGSAALESDLDAEQRAKMRWNDPAQKFLENKKPSKTNKYPEYKGYAPPNRFGIRPGYRWDGVDRSNGFENELFKSQAAADTQKSQDYAYSVADW
ncbi:Pre-mRNA-splicing factor cwc26 [Coemansia sp. RSA 989]|nr:Pre-mRNA-splicing factor cwc26 [Coemansia sp. RSA 1086]KAJ1862489.1 Pre-mRNA-splicing factor cwc26 [Coemansia sp. RSA 989]KAJ1870052.1 Pre-mRNA-splicing factor cwc26 [Coemansia sp. RSA 990]